MADDLLEVEVTIGEDFAVQLFWTDEYGNPIPISDPMLMDVKDANGQLAIRFSDQQNPATQAYIGSAGYAGFFQLTAPRAVTQTLIPGRYVFDLFAAVADSSTPFDRQVQQVVSGYLVANPRVTILEGAGNAVINI